MVDELSGREAKVTRKEFLTYAGTAGVAATAGCLGLGDDDTIAIATVDDFSGPYAASGTNDRRGVEFALMDNDYEVDGMEIEHHTRDTELDPELGVRRSRDVIQSEDALMVKSGASSAVQQAMSEVTEAEETLFFTDGWATDLTGGSGHQYAFRWSSSNWAIARNAVSATLDETDIDTVYNLTMDYSWGYDIEEQANAVFEERGVEILGEDYVPLGEAEFDPYITNALEEDPDAILVAQYGANLINGVSQLHEFGAKDQAELIVPGDGLDMLRGMGIAAAQDVYIGNHWFHTLDEPWAQEFVERFTEEFDDNPMFIAAGAYVMTQNLLEAIEQTGTTDKLELIDYLEGLEFEGPTGEEYIREWDHQVIHDYYLGYGNSPEEFSEDEENYMDIIASNDLYPEREHYEDPWRD